MATITNYSEWFTSGLGVALPTWFGGPVGQKWGAATGAILDGPVALLKSGVQARYPDYAPTDALPHIGADRRLIQGPNETNASFTTRLKDAWAIWSRAGTPCSVLENLFYYGLGSTTTHWVQQNGLQYTFSGDPTPGQDPTSLIVASNDPVLAATLTSAVAPYRTIPAGTPWFQLQDGNTDLANRFAIIASVWPFAALGVAVFSNSDTATVTWPFTFGDTAYHVVVGPPTDNVILDANAATVATTGLTLNASAPWSGVVYVLAFEAGVNPLNFFTSASVGALKTIIKTFRPNAICTGLYAITTGGRTWDYFPPGTTWDGGTYPQWDTNTVSQILGAI